MGTFAALIEQLDPVDDKRRGTQFERICRWFLLNDPVYKGMFRKVWYFTKWPDRWSNKDLGTDLIAEDTQGRFWAIQAKCYQQGKYVNHTDMGKFLADSNRDVISYRLLISSSDGLGPNAKAVFAGQPKDKPVVTVLGSDLENRPGLNWPGSLSELKAPQPPPHSPREHQVEAIDDVVAGFETAGRGQMIMACGTGKTLTALFIKEKLRAQRTLVLVPSLLLLKQTLSEWRANARTAFDFQAVCSDESVSEDDDAVLSTTAELGVPVTTDPEEIGAFLRRGRKPLVVFATYQSSPVIAEGMRLNRVPGFDLTIADEAHRCAGPLSSPFATILDDAKIRARRRLFMTAIPRNFSDRVLQQAESAALAAETIDPALDLRYASMNDPRYFGAEFHHLSFREAIDRKLLSSYRVYIIDVDDTRYRQWAQEGRFVTINGVEVRDARALAGQIAVARAIHELNLRRVITFHRLIRNAKDFAESLPQVIDYLPEDEQPAGVWSKSASSKMSAGARAQLLQQLRELPDGERGLLSNARCLTEGVDVPTLDGIAFIDPKRSVADIGQAFGRVIRPAAGKEFGHIIVPVFVAADDPDAQGAVEDSPFDAVWDVIQAISAHDERLAEYLDTFRRALGVIHKTHPVKIPPPEQIDLPGAWSEDFAAAFMLRLVQLTTDAFEETIGMLSRYKDEHGDIDVPQDYETETGVALGARLSYLRVSKRKGFLVPDRIRRLEELGMVWEPHDAAFRDGVRHVRKYLDREKNVRIKKDYVDPDDDFPTGQWLSKQCVIYRRGLLSDDRRMQLEAMGVVLQGRRSTPKTLTPEQKAEIRRIYADGEATQEELAQRYGVKSVSQILHRGGIRNFRHLKQAEKGEILSAYTTKTKTRQELAAQYGVSEATIYAVLRDGGVQFSRARKLTDVDKKGILAAYTDEGVTQRDLATQYGVSFVTIGKILRDAGISKKKTVTESQKQEIRRSYATGQVNQYQLARQYGLGQGSISRILRAADPNAPHG